MEGIDQKRKTWKGHEWECLGWQANGRPMLFEKYLFNLIHYADIQSRKPIRMNNHIDNISLGRSIHRTYTRNITNKQQVNKAS